MICALLAVFATLVHAENNYGPYNVTILEGGVGLERPLSASAPLLAAKARWSVTGWINVARERAGTIVVAAIGESAGTSCRCLLLQDGRPALAMPGGERVVSSVALRPQTWTAIAATYDGNTA